MDITVETTHHTQDQGDLHFLRLALDLQVDAMLLALGAAAHADDEQIPWRRWVVEDLDVARMLARTILSEHVEPPTVMGTGMLGTDAEAALDDLIARYSSMHDLLGDVLRRPYAGQPWRRTAHEAFDRCAARLDELHRHRGTASVRTAHRCPEFLPGELLG
jgi:hypothetical protein